MTAVLKVFERLNIKWKKIGSYNMKCLWIPPFAAYPKSTVGNDPAKDHIYSVDSSILAMNRRAIRSPNAVKFEIQVRLSLHSDIDIYNFGLAFMILFLRLFSKDLIVIGWDFEGTPDRKNISAIKCLPIEVGK